MPPSAPSTKPTYARLLQSSKLLPVLSSDPTRPPQTITSPSAYRDRLDFGLKRSMPPQLRKSRSSPYITLHALDTRYHQTDYRSARLQASFVKMWTENECGVVSAPPQHHVTLSSDGVKPIRLTLSHFDARGKHEFDSKLEQGASQGKREGTEAEDGVQREHDDGEGEWDEAREQHSISDQIASMTAKQFDQFLKTLEGKRNQFRAFLGQRKKQDEALRRNFSRHYEPTRTAPLEPVGAIEPDVFEFAQGVHQNPGAHQRTLSEFLHHLSTSSPLTSSSPSPTTAKSPTTTTQQQPQLTPNPHPNLGLAYSHKDSLHTYLLSEPVDGRVVENGFSASKGDSRQQAVVSGLVAPIGGGGGSNTTTGLAYPTYTQSPWGYGYGNNLASDPHLNVTQFEPDPQNGRHDLSRGRTSFTITHASIDPHHLPKDSDFQPFNPKNQVRDLPGAPIKYHDPRKVNAPTGFENGRIQMIVKESKRLSQLRGDGRAIRSDSSHRDGSSSSSSGTEGASVSFCGPRLGDQDWVGSEESASKSSLSSHVDWLTEYLKSATSSSSSTERSQRSFQTHLVSPTTTSDSVEGNQSERRDDGDRGGQDKMSQMKGGSEADKALLRLLDSMGRSSSSSSS